MSVAAALRVMVQLKRGDTMKWVPIEVSDDELKSTLLKLALATPPSSSAAATPKVAAKRHGGGGDGGGGGDERNRIERTTSRGDESAPGDHAAVDDAKHERASKNAPTEVEYIEFTGARRQRWMAIVALDVDTEWFQGMPRNTVASSLLADKCVRGDVLIVRLEPAADRVDDTHRPLDLEWSDWHRWTASSRK